MVVLLLLPPAAVFPVGFRVTGAMVTVTFRVEHVRGCCGLACGEPPFTSCGSSLFFLGLLFFHSDVFLKLTFSRNFLGFT